MKKLTRMDHLSKGRENLISSSNWVDNYASQIAQAVKNLGDMSLIKTNEQRIRQVLDRVDCETYLQIISKLLIPSKSAEVSVRYRIQGDFHFKSHDKGSQDKAFEKYTKSIAYAPAKSRELSLAFANRSAVLFKAKWFEDCLKDINLALENDYPDNLKTKLYLRRASCLQALKPNDQAAVDEAFAKAQQYLARLTIKDQEAVKKMIIDQQKSKPTENEFCYNLHFADPPPKLRDENPIVPGLSDAVELKFSEEFGRHVIAKRDIKSGEVVGAQKPYVNIICQKERYKFCWHCGNQTWSSLPCSNCSEVVFCSEFCRDKANLDYHDIECEILEQALFEYPNKLLMSLRLTILGFKEAGKCLNTFKDNCEKINVSKDSLEKGFTNGKFDQSKFSSAYGLLYHNSKDFKSSALLHLSILVAFLFADKIGYLKNESKKNLEALKNDENFVFLIGVIEQTCLISCYNPYEIEIPLVTKTEQKTISSALVPALSFFNHSCDQMLTHHFRGGSMVTTALRPIKQGEQVFESYGPKFFISGVEERQRFYFENYNFKCKCEACIDDWPLTSPCTPMPVLAKWNMTKLIPDFVLLMKKVEKYLNESDGWFKKTNQFLDGSEIQAQIGGMIEETYDVFDKKTLEHHVLARSLERAIIFSSKRYLKLD